MRGSRRFGRFCTALPVVLSAALVGCGGGERQDENEPSGNYRVEVIGSSFPSRQSIAEQSPMTISVRNADERTIPNLAVTVSNFGRASQDRNLADPERPIWIVDHDPTGARTSYTNTWALGPLRPGEERTLAWRVTAIEPGVHTVRFKVAAGLDGKAKATTAAGGEPEGSFTVQIEGKPADARVDPKTGKVVRKAPKGS